MIKRDELSNADSCINRAEDNEPVFVLLARDASTPDLVRQWALGRMSEIQRGYKPISDMDMVTEALRFAFTMEAWRNARKPSSM